MNNPFFTRASRAVLLAAVMTVSVTSASAKHSHPAGGYLHPACAGIGVGNKTPYLFFLVGYRVMTDQNDGQDDNLGALAFSEIFIKRHYSLPPNSPFYLGQTEAWQHHMEGELQFFIPYLNSPLDARFRLTRNAACEASLELLDPIKQTPHPLITGYIVYECAKPGAHVAGRASKNFFTLVLTVKDGAFQPPKPGDNRPTNIQLRAVG